MTRAAERQPRTAANERTLPVLDVPVTAGRRGTVL